MLRPGSRPGVQGRQAGTVRLIGANLRLGDVQGGDAQVGIVGQCALHQGVEFGTVELMPPARCIDVGTGHDHDWCGLCCGVAHGDGGGQL